MDLSFNDLSSKGIVSLADKLRWSGLNYLNISNNKVGIEGALAVAEVLKYCNFLETIDIRCNSIGLIGGGVLSKAKQSLNDQIMIIL